MAGVAGHGDGGLSEPPEVPHVKNFPGGCSRPPSCPPRLRRSGWRARGWRVRAPARRRSVRSRPGTPPPGRSSATLTPSSTCATPGSTPARSPASATACSSGPHGLVVTLGVTASASGPAYTQYATVYDRSTHAVIALEPERRVLRRQRERVQPSRPAVRPRYPAGSEHQLLPGRRQPGNDRGLQRRVQLRLVLHGHRAVVHPGQDRHRLRQLAVGRVVLTQAARESGQGRRLQQRAADHVQRPHLVAVVVVGAPPRCWPTPGNSQAATGWPSRPACPRPASSFSTYLVPQSAQSPSQPAVP